MTAVIETGLGPAGMEEADDFAIEIEGVSLRYGPAVALRDLSLHVPYGAIYGLVGPSGAGKTTTMRILATLQRPDTGTVRVDGIDILAHPAAARRHIGYLPDIAGLYENLTVREYLDFYAALQGIPARLRRQSTDELVELIGLTAERDRAVRALSRGMRQQLGVARCLIHDPSVLLLDEPAAGMDPRARLDLRDILQELARLGKTILISSHMLSELAEVCTHLGFMRAGELLAEGETEEMVSAALPEARLRVRLLDIRGRDAARAVLEAHGASRDVEAVGDLELHAWFSGTHGDLAALLEEIRAGGVPVTEFALEEPELDDVYLLLSGSGAQT